MQITNAYSAPLTLPNGQSVPPRGSVDVPDIDWSGMKDNFVVKAWLSEKKLSKGALAPEEVDAEGDTAAMAEMRKRFDISFAQANENITRLHADVASRDAEIADLKTRLAASTVSPPAAVQTAPPASGYAVKERSQGWFAVILSDGTEVTKSLRKSDLDGFDAMSEQDKAAFVELHKAEV